MASTFTSNINLEKPAQGDQVDAWGTTVNSNSDIIDTQIANKLPLAGGTITGDVIFDGSNDITYDNSESKIKFHDSAKATFGNSDDLQIYHDGANSFIADASGTGDIKIRSSNVRMENATGTLGVFVDGSNNNVALYQSGNVKLQTTSSGISATGDIAVTGTVDGRDVATDGSKLDGIEASADVTDATNVNAAGAIMNSDVATKGQIIVGDGSGDPTILSVGTDGHYLKADSSAGSGVAWASVPAGVGGANGVHFNDSVKATFGDSGTPDLEIYHDTNNSIIADTNNGDLKLRGASEIAIEKLDGTSMAKFQNDGYVKLYHSGSEKLATSATGVTIAGTLTATTLSGSLPYSDLTGTPTIPTNNVTLTNGAGYITSVSGNITQLTNNAGYVTSSGVTSVATGNGLSGGTITSTGTLTMSGSYSGSFSASSNITAYSSDERLKNFRGKIENPLDKINQLNGYYYEWNDLAKSLDDGRSFKEGMEVGVNAQEVEKVLPECVTTAPIVKIENLDTDYKTVYYDRIVPLLIEGIKELKAEIEELKKR